MKKLLLFILPIFLFSYQVVIKKWEKGETFFGFLQKYHIPLSLFYSLDKKTRKKLAFISNNRDIYLLKDGNFIKQALIPLNSKEQLQIVKIDNNYITKIVPIYYNEELKKVSLNIENFLSYDLYRATKNPYLTHKLVDIFSDRINFRVLPKNSQIDIYYKVKSRFGKIVGVNIIFARIKNRYYDISAYRFKDGRYYDQDGKSLKGMFLAYPMKFTKISSKFGMRFHPILKRWRMHDGIDFVNKIGTPIHSVADGKVIYKGWLGGYGKTIKIKHKNGYITLYGHMRRYGRVKVGQYVSQGKIIGYMGNTGMSTGPHLHFGVMRYGKWINPARIKKSAKIKLYGKTRKEFLAYVSLIDKEVESKVALK